MSQQQDPTNKIGALQIAAGTMNQPQPTDPNLELIYQSLLCDDPEVKRLIKGEVQEPLNRWRQIIEMLNSCVSERDESPIITQQQAAQIIALMRESNTLMDRLEKQMKKYRYYLPHLLMLSPLMRLSIITQKQANKIKLRQQLMVNRDRLRASSSPDHDLLDENWFDAVLIAENMAVQESVEGRKLEAITKDTKQVTTVINDQTRQKSSRSFWRPFG
jgi:hypothetical protein